MLKENNQKAEAVVMIFSPFTSLVWICLALYILFAALLFGYLSMAATHKFQTGIVNHEKKTARPQDDQVILALQLGR